MEKFIENTKNRTKPKLQAKQGLSFLVTTTIDGSKVLILMDTGPSSGALLHNVNEMDINLQNVDVVALSHGHYDHTGSLIEAIKQIKKQVPVIAYPKSFKPKLKMIPHLKLIGAPFRLSDIESAGGLPLLATDLAKIADGITTTGEVPRITAFESV